MHSFQKLMEIQMFWTILNIGRSKKNKVLVSQLLNLSAEIANVMCLEAYFDYGHIARTQKLKTYKPFRFNPFKIMFEIL